jgi:hypothetical protein
LPCLYRQGNRVDGDGTHVAAGLLGAHEKIVEGSCCL